MFAKLLKHELRSCAGFMGIISLGSLGVGVASGFLLRYMEQSANQMITNESLEMLLGILFFFAFLALFAFAVIGGIFPITQFYKRKFTDQGYLTFTLPVRSWQIYLSSLLNLIVWGFVCALSMFVSFILVFLIGFMNTEVWNEMVRSFSFLDVKEVFAEMDFMNPLYLLINSACSVMIMMNSMILGAMFAKKHKILVAVGVYYLTSMVMGAVSTALTNLEYITDPMLAIERMQTVTVLTTGAVGIVGAVLAIWLMDKKLNLP